MLISRESDDIARSFAGKEPSPDHNGICGLTGRVSSMSRGNSGVAGGRVGKAEGRVGVKVGRVGVKAGRDGVNGCLIGSIDGEECLTAVSKGHPLRAPPSLPIFNDSREFDGDMESGKWPP